LRQNNVYFGFSLFVLFWGLLMLYLVFGGVDLGSRDIRLYDPGVQSSAVRFAVLTIVVGLIMVLMNIVGRVKRA
jgi:hypothetical protein